MPKFSTSARHASHQDGKKIKKSKQRGHQYRDAAKARKLRKTRIKGIVEEVVETVEPGKPRPLRRGPKYDFAKIERKIRASCEETQPVNPPIIPAEVYGANPVNFNVPRVMVPISEATAKRKQEAASDDDGDATDVDESEDAVVVPAGFVEAAEKLGLLNVPAASSGHQEEFEVFEEPPSTSHAQPDEKPPPTEHLSTEVKTPPPSAVPHTISSVPSPSSSTRPLRSVPEPVVVEAAYNDSQTTAATSTPTYPEPSEPSASISVPQSALVEAVYNDSQTTAATNFPTYLESSEPSAPISVPQAGSVPESSQEAVWSSGSQHQNSAFWENNMNDAQAFHFQNIPHAFYVDSTNDDVNMEFSVEPPVYSLPTTWISPQLQPEHQPYYSHVGQIADYNSYYQTYAMGNIHPNWASMQFQPVKNEPVQQSAQTDQQPFNHAVDPLRAASCFWTAIAGNPGTSHSPTAVPKIMKSTPTPVDEQQPQEEPTKLSLLIRQDSNQDIRRHLPDNNRGVHPFPSLRGYKNMGLISMSRELEEPRVVSRPGHRRLIRPPVGSEMDLVNRLRMEAEWRASPRMLKTEHMKRRREDSQPDFARTSHPDMEVPPRQRRRCEPDVPKLKTPAPAQKRSRRLHRRYEAPSTAPTSSRTTSGWNFSKFCPPISSFADRLFKFF